MTALPRPAPDASAGLANTGPLLLVGSVGLAFILVVAGFLGFSRQPAGVQATVGNFTVLLAAGFACSACFRAARRRTAAARGWALMGVSTGLWTLGQVIYTYYGLSRDNVHPFPSWAEAACLSFYIPAIAALFAFPRPRARLISRLRLVLDVLVISTGTLFLSEAVVLHHLHEAANMERLAVWTGVAYPVLDVTICALVFSFGVRQTPTVRRIWLCLGGGLVILALTNSMHIRCWPTTRRC